MAPLGALTLATWKEATISLELPGSKMLTSPGWLLKFVMTYGLV